MRQNVVWSFPPWAFVNLLLIGAGCDVSVGSSDSVDPGGSGAAQGPGVGTGGSLGGASGGSSSSGGSGDGVVPPGMVVGAGLPLAGRPEYHEIVRLTHEQWENSVRAIFGLTAETGLVSTLHPDPPNGKFSNNELSLYVEGALWTDYDRAAETVAKKVATDPALTAALGGLANRDAFIEKIGRRAFRRELTPEQKTAYQGLWDAGARLYASGDDAVDGARVFLEALLQSPHFLYRNEIEAPGTRLSGTALATKLSLLLRNSLPSEALLDAAAFGELDTDAGLTALAEQMLEEDGALGVFARFHTELYGLDRYTNIEKSATSFPQYTTDVNQMLLDADIMFFTNVFEEDGGLRDILTSDVAYVNSKTAPFYGLTATGTTLQQVTLDGTRPGYLTRTGFLTYNATLSQPDPIHRGVNVNNRFLCADLSPPAGVIPPLPEPRPGQTNRERVTAHTAEGSCAGCHMKIINPLGFAFENFDAIGRTRTMDNGNPINTADVYAFTDGDQTFADASELIHLLAEHKQTHGCYTASLAEYVLARDVAGTEEALVTSMMEASVGRDASIKALVLSMVQDPLFTTAQGAAK